MTCQCSDNKYIEGKGAKFTWGDRPVGSHADYSQTRNQKLLASHKLQNQLR